MGTLCPRGLFVPNSVGIKYPLLLTTILMILGHFVPIRALYAHCDEKQLWFGTLVPREHKCATVGIQCPLYPSIKNEYGSAFLAQQGITCPREHIVPTVTKQLWLGTLGPLGHDVLDKNLYGHLWTFMDIYEHFCYRISYQRF